ncbi:DUF6207 family protein [Streptomyces sp. NPDC006208]|uniref:DUF6207 family protein n=1 Tax=Streptomyces sp. NPDC006208 TaxID=3156734 RepID=UPI0033B8ECB5
MPPPRRTSHPGLVVHELTAADEATAQAVMHELEQCWATSGTSPVPRRPGEPGMSARVHAGGRPPAALIPDRGQYVPAARTDACFTRGARPRGNIAPEGAASCALTALRRKAAGTGLHANPSHGFRRCGAACRRGDVASWSRA